jgi:tetrahydromethanopterin S-methyltransferase subunit G
MSKSTFNNLSQRITVIETQLQERWTETIQRIKRLEGILIGSAGATIVLLLTMLYKG